jgi:hypothetical protein
MLAAAPPLQHRVIPLTGLLIMAAVIGSCSSSSAPSGTEPDPALGPEPVLWNFGVDFDAAFDLGGVGTIIYKFLEFGFVVNDQSGQPKSLPHFTYVFDRQIEVISPIEGVVASVRLQEELTQDFVIWLKPRGGPTLWLVELDHVTGVAVAEGDEVSVGDFLGYPAQGAVEVMVNGPNAHVCPWQVFDPAAAAALQAKLVQFMAAWDAAKWALPPDHEHHPNHPSSRYTPYDSVEMVVPGCRSWEVPYPEP